jgi:nucleotide-binding universal stress UspA family protein
MDWYLSEAEGKAYLDASVVPLRKAALRVEQVLLKGQATQNVAEFVRSHNVDLFVVSSHGKKDLGARVLEDSACKTIAFKDDLFI